MSICRPSAALALLLLAGSALGQTQWVRRLINNGPNWSSMQGIAYDSKQGVVVIFGNSSTWEWNGIYWRQRFPSPFPESRNSHAMAYDENRGVVVLSGGRNFGGRLPDTWEWDGTSWVFKHTFPHSNDAFVFSVMAYDAMRKQVVRYSATNAWGRSKTEAWNGQTWTLLTSGGPSVREETAMAYDAARGVVVMYGGFGSGIAGLNDTWELRGNNWIRRIPPQNPPGVYRHNMAYDSLRERVILFGGISTHLDPGETWEWDGQTWKLVVTAQSPGAGDRFAATYDSRREQMVMFGADRETWEYGLVDPATYSSFGAGCAGSTGVPNLAPVLGARPWIGEVLQLQLTGAPPASQPLLVLGLSDSTWGSFSLPLDLSFTGLPGCFAHVSVDALAAIQNLGPVGLASVTIPRDPSLAGLEVYVQAVVPDLSANPAGAVLSNGIKLTVGVK